MLVDLYSGCSMVSVVVTVDLVINVWHIKHKNSLHVHGKCCVSTRHVICICMAHCADIRDTKSTSPRL